MNNSLTLHSAFLGLRLRPLYCWEEINDGVQRSGVSAVTSSFSYDGPWARGLVHCKQCQAGAWSAFSARRAAQGQFNAVVIRRRPAKKNYAPARANPRLLLAAAALSCIAG